MRVIRVGNLRQYFTANELSGWPDGIQYGYQPPKRRRQRIVDEATPVDPPKAVKVTSGKLLRMV